MKLKDEEKRKAIIQQTIDIVYEKGFSGVKMADLAKQVGISPSTLYVYFKNKEDLLVSICVFLIKQQTEKSSNEVEGHLPYKLKLKKLWLFWVLFSINNAKEMSFLMQIKQSPYYEIVPVEVKDRKMKLGFDLIDYGKREGLIKNLKNEVLAGIMGALMMETVKMISDKTIEFNNESLDLMYDMLWDAIKS